jgi:probable F420-dependent oxidoreductase
MKIGVVFPQNEIGGSVGAITTYTECVEELGFDHILIYDHVVGADPRVHEGWNAQYDVTDEFHEPFTLFGYLAAITSLELVTGIIALPQRQTVLVAKQAAEIDLLTEGRFRLGVGLGWSRVEYEALGKSFSDKGKRIEEQIVLLRRLWTEPSFTFEGDYERITGAGLTLLPVQRPIPIWYGGESPIAYERAGRVAEGWIPDNMLPGPELDAAKEIVEASAVRAGRDPADLGLQGRVKWAKEEANYSVDRVVELVEAWRDTGATHVALNTMYAGLPSIEEHMEVLRTLSEALDVKAVNAHA